MFLASMCILAWAATVVVAFNDTNDLSSHYDDSTNFMHRLSSRSHATELEYPLPLYHDQSPMSIKAPPGEDIEMVPMLQNVDEPYDAYSDQVYERNLVIPRTSKMTSNRHLSATSALIGTFYPLTCNAEMSLLDCSINKTSSLTLPTAGTTSPLIIPCGTCYTFDLGSNVSLPTGLRVMGKLVFPTNYLTNIYTSYVVVQGEMVVRSNSSVISPSHLSVRFVLTGTTDTILDTSSSDSKPNTLACNNTLCNLGKKAFVMAGGKLDIQAFPPTCKSWTKVKDTVLQKPLKNSSLFASTVYPPAQCSLNGSLVFFNDSFSTFSGNWTGREGGYVFHNQIDGTLTVANRKFNWQGPHIDLTRLMSSSCLIPDQDYLLTARIRLDKADGTGNGTPTPCSVNNTFCPQLSNRIGKASGGDWWRGKYGLLWKYSGNFGEFVDFSGTIRWSADEVDPNSNAYWTLYIEGPRAGVMVTLDYFTISLPDPSSYLNPSDVCQELLPNGNAEGNGLNPYPFWSLRGDEKVKVMNENSNNFFRLENRLSHWSTITYNIETRCLDIGVTYFASAKIRIQSDFPQSYYILLTIKRADGSWTDRTIVNCPSQSRFDGWVTCSGEFMVDTDLSRALSASWRLYLTNTRDGIYTVDYDDLSIRFARGYVDKLIVDSNDASCWGVGSDLHVTSSTFFNDDGQIRPNGYKGKIVQLANTGSGTQLIQISPAPTLPILSLLENSLYAAEVALLSRNVIIEGFNNEVYGKGAYVQILHTPDISQTIQGVQFLNMGRISEYDHFALEILYSGSIAGTYIAKNAIVDSNHRGIVVEGSSNISIFDNVAYNVSGHAFYVGDQSQSNVFERNIGSQTKTISYSNTISGENDYSAAAFYSRYPPNSFLGNVASGNAVHGFYFDMSWMVRTESWTQSNTLGSAYSYPLGSFSKNTAHSNQNSGFALYNFAQAGSITFDSIISYKNRDRGLILWNSRRATVSGGIIADNRCGLEARYSDNLTLDNVDIRGFSNATRNATRPPYFWKLCPSASSVVGYRLNTFINSGTETKGVTVKNIAFTEFDTSPDCPKSVAIELNSLDVTDAHFDYLSSFRNVSISDSRSNYYINACLAQSVGINDIVLTDIDGGIFNRGNASGPYSIVSNTNAMTAFTSSTTSSCLLYPEVCLAYCASTCLRTVEYFVEQIGTRYWALQLIKDNGDGVFDYSDNQIVVGGKFRYDGNDTTTIDTMQHELNYRKFSVSLPMGSYRAQFLDETGTVSWPRFVIELWKSPPECNNYPSPKNVTLFEPPVGDCSNLIENGNFENGSSYPWHHRNDGYLRILPGAGLNGSTALMSKRSWIYDGVGINFDTRCLRGNSGRFYEIKAWVRLSFNGAYVICNPNSNDEKDMCPSSTFGVYRFDNHDTKVSVSPSYYNYKAKMLFPYRSDQFNLIHGIFKVDDVLSSAQRVYFYFEIFNRTFDLILDEVSVTPFDVNSRCNGDLIRNGNFSLQSSMYWRPWGSPKLQMLNGSDYSTGYAMMAYGRTWDDWGLSQDLYCTSLVAGDRFAAIVKYKLLMTNTSMTFRCNRTSDNLDDSCMQVRFYTSKNGINTWPWLGETVASFENDWNYATGLYVVEPNAVKADMMTLYFSRISPSLSIVYDTVSFTPLRFSCQSLVLNPSFDDGKTSFFYADARARMKVSIQSPGFGGSGYAALLYDRNDYDRSLVQNLDTRCFYNNAIYSINAKFKLLNNTNFSPVTCDTNARDGARQCPSIRLYGSQCFNNTNTYLTFWSIWQWNANTFNNFTADITVSPSLATCKIIQVFWGRSINPGVAVLIDDVQIVAKSTLNPTPFPTLSPASSQLLKTTGTPSVRKSLAPTSSMLTCPIVGNAPMTLVSKTVMLKFSDAERLCTLVKVTVDTGSGNVTAIIPLAHSYDGYSWDLASGDYAASFSSLNIFQCYDRGCQFNLPSTSSNEFFQLRSYQYILPEMDQFARLLERTSFGITQSDLNAISSLSSNGTGNLTTNALSYKIALWVQTQMMLRISSHREFWRQGSNPRLPGPSIVGLPSRPCQVGARFRRFAFVRNDYWYGTSNSVRLSSTNFPIVVRMNGIPRTVIGNISIINNQYTNYTFNTTRDYALCGSPEERVGGRMYITLEDGTCQPISNPAINFTGFENLPTYVLSIPAGAGVLRSIDVPITRGDEFLLMLPLGDSSCSKIPDVVDFHDPPVFGALSDGCGCNLILDYIWKIIQY